MNRRGEADEPVEAEESVGAVARPAERPDRDEAPVAADGGGYGVGRLLTLVDGVFAISMTLLALDVRIPDDVPATEAGFAEAIWPLLGRMGVFVVAFVITGRFWRVSHRQLATLHRVDAGVLRRTVLFLTGITALPVATNVLFRYGSVPAAVTFAAVILAVTSALAGRLWWYLSSPERGLARVGTDDRRRWMLRTVLVILVFLLAIPVAYALPGDQVAYAPLVWLLLAAIDPVTGRLYGRVRARSADRAGTVRRPGERGGAGS